MGTFNGKPVVTVKDIMVFLGSKLVQYDARCSARGDSNIYRLGHLLAAHSKVEGLLVDLMGYHFSGDGSEGDRTLAANVRAALAVGFIVKNGIAPVNQTLRAIDKALRGERVKITDQTGARTHVG